MLYHAYIEEVSSIISWILIYAGNLPQIQSTRKTNHRALFVQVPPCWVMISVDFSPAIVTRNVHYWATYHEISCISTEQDGRLKNTVAEVFNSRTQTSKLQLLFLDTNNINLINMNVKQGNSMR
jgi:hypothetical protein